MKTKALISVAECDKNYILRILDNAQHFERSNLASEPELQAPLLLNRKVIAVLFYEASTRTCDSFKTAVYRLGGQTVGFSDASASSVVKGESLGDTIRMYAGYSDLIILRHFLDGSARYAAEIASQYGIPVVNAGDGANQHPSQTMLDLYAILKTQKRLNNLRITIVGDLKYGRTVHSLVVGTSHFSPTFTFVAPEELQMPKEQRHFCDERGIAYKQCTEFTNDIIAQSDIVYMTRIQKERFSDPLEYERFKNAYILKSEMLKGCKPNLRILHPLPRVTEIDLEIDNTPYAYYIQQAHDGVYVRQAIICDLLNLIQ